MSTTQTTDNENGLALVGRGYDEPTRCLHFRVCFAMSAVGCGDGTECALIALRILGDYVGGNATELADALAPLTSKFWQITVGREFSPVVYVDVMDEATKPEVEAIFRAAGADELDWAESGLGRTLRAWWD